MVIVSTEDSAHCCSKHQTELYCADGVEIRGLVTLGEYHTKRNWSLDFLYICCSLVWYTWYVILGKLMQSSLVPHAFVVRRCTDYASVVPLNGTQGQDLLYDQTIVQQNSDKAYTVHYQLCTCT